MNRYTLQCSDLQYLCSLGRMWRSLWRVSNTAMPQSHSVLCRVALQKNVYDGRVVHERTISGHLDRIQLSGHCFDVRFNPLCWEVHWMPKDRYFVNISNTAIIFENLKKALVGTGSFPPKWLFFFRESTYSLMQPCTLFKSPAWKMMSWKVCIGSAQ